MSLNKEELDYISNLENSYRELKGQNSQLFQSNQSTIYGGNNEQNLIEWQLDLSNELERIEHLLRGDQLIQDEKRGLVWRRQKDPKNIIFNDYGVDTLLTIISFYLNKNTLLSNYEENIINQKVFNLGIEISDLIHNQYEDLFYMPKFEELRDMVLFDLEFAKSKNKFINSYIKSENEKIMNEELDYKKLDKLIEQKKSDILRNKLKRYPIIVLQITDSVHSAYLRALHGNELESLRTARQVTQSEPIGNALGYSSMNRKQFSLWRPSTWVR